ncbi:MAG: 23S rRNA (uracil(1939)-C(5))-methyltransferase RlmD [Chitinispirillaceae bacterium]|nr:23S rRNA (uracil(1939)-C(5))-methyltransferase RlmD [Chitinispirillaceae bacterium]
MDRESENKTGMNCPHFSRCGGCQTLDLPYTRQLSEKRALLESFFSSMTRSPVQPVIPCENPCYYRHKVQLPFGLRKQGRSFGITLGCYARDSHEVVDQRVCLVQDRELSTIAWTVRKWAAKCGLSVYDEKKHAGFLRHLLLRKAAGTGEVLVGLITNGEKPPGSRHLSAGLLDMIADRFPDKKSPVVGIVQNVNLRHTNVVLGEREYAWWGRPFLFEKLGQWRFKLGLSTFFQVNPFQTVRLYDEVLKWIDHGPSVLDCYCGVGSISLWISKKSRIVTGIEENGASIAAAKKAALINGTRNIRFIGGDTAALLPQMMNEGYEIALFDPPRKGLEAGMVRGLRTSSFRRIIYVSCNPETLARDVAGLRPGWDLISLQGVDMFPHTRHIECVAVLDRNSG